MKKIFSMLLMGMMLMGMTSCLDNNENNETNFTLSMYNRTVTMGSEDVSEFNVNNSAFKINYTNSAISVNVMATVDKDNTIQFKIDDMQLTADQGMQAYRFSCPAATTQGVEITNFRGIIDLQVGVLYMTYNVGADKTVHATAALPFLRCKTNIDPTDETKQDFSSEKTQYDFRINKSNMTATVTIVGFAKDADQKEASENIAVFEGLNVKFTRSGYKITAPMVKSTTTGVGNVSDATIKDVEFNIIDQGIRFNGKYETNTYEAETAGTMFNEKTV